MPHRNKHSPKQTLAFGYKKVGPKGQIEICKKQAYLIKRTFEQFIGQREYDKEHLSKVSTVQRSMLFLIQK